MLVVEDFEAFRRLICSILQQRAEFKIAEASDGLEALRKIEQLRPDLILLDIGLPGLNGIEVCKCACKVAPSAKIMFVSQECSPDVVRDALSVGAQSYVQKSNARSDLLPAVDAVLGGGCFVSKGVLEMSSAEGPVREFGAWKYPWQQSVMDAFQSPRKSLPIMLGVAQRAIAGRLCDANLMKEERSALKRALWSLNALRGRGPRQRLPITSETPPEGGTHQLGRTLL